ncbi:unnamed protein product, partial [Mesorhabditis belari]|uniref:Poly A polymerase head domain-containing protein n=1 Tax=Mesorhabditis belari TaxID=2138241 RepID=A0AAF3F7B8_9BILA
MFLFLCFLLLFGIKALELENLCGELEEIDKSSVHFPKSYGHFGLPWHYFKRSKVYAGTKLLKSWNLVKQHKIQGLNETVEGLIKFLDESRCLFFVYGGAVRDLVIGEYPMDIDGTVTCNPHRLKRICKFRYGLGKCKRPHFGSEKLTIGAIPDENDTNLSLEPIDLAHWNTSFEVFGSDLEFSVNTLSLYNDPEDLDKIYLIDLTGDSLSDLCKKKITIPTKDNYWNEWVSLNKLYRFSKLRACGFAASDEKILAFIVQKVKENYDEVFFKKFFCHSFLDGSYEVKGNVCVHQFVNARKKQRIQTFVNSLQDDYGFDFYEKKFKNAILEIYSLEK